MRIDRRPFAGRTEAIGFLLDPAHVGGNEVAVRLATWWASGASLHHVGDRVLLLLPAPVSVRAELAPGLPVCGDRTAVEMIVDGKTRTVRVDTLRLVDLTTIVDVGDVVPEVFDLVPSAPVPAPVPARILRSDGPPVRERAGVGRRSSAAERQVARLQRETAGAQPGLVAKLLGRTSPERMLSRRNARYVDDLAKRLGNRDWDTALSSAIGIGGLGGKAWAFRLPQRGRVTGPRTRTATGGGAHAFEASLQDRLRQMYVEAADQLEREGKYLLAAFVHSDLLNNPLAAIELVERNGDYRTAAEMAENLVADPALSVRLWWRAGDRERAVAVARARGAFADAVARLEKVDTAAAHDLRRTWVTALRDAGDHAGAVAAAWPVPSLRDEVVPDLGIGIARGGPASGALLAHLLEHVSVETARDAARQLLVEDAGPARDAFLTALPRHAARGAGTDRELASLALLAIVRDPGTLPAGTVKEVRRKLEKRADPLIVADLPHRERVSSDTTAVLRFDLGDTGPVSVHDAVATDGGSVLLALGERGARLVGRDGRTRAEWSEPTYSVVMADHGARALLLAPRGDRYVVHELDLPNGRPRLLPPLRQNPLPSYDGSRVVLVGPDGVQWVEVKDGRWAVVWRELADGQRVHAVERVSDSMTVLFSDYDGVQAWQWELPAVVLRQRGSVDLPVLPLVRATGTLGTLQAGRGVVQLSWHSPYGHRISAGDLYPNGELRLLVTGNIFTLRETSEHHQTLTVHSELLQSEVLVAHLPVGTEPIVRSHGDLVTIGHADGRLVVVDVVQRRTVSDVRLTV